MPIYEYQCLACGQSTQALRRMSQADAPMRCEHCGDPRTQRGP